MHLGASKARSKTETYKALQISIFFIYISFMCCFSHRTHGLMYDFMNADLQRGRGVAMKYLMPGNSMTVFFSNTVSYCAKEGCELLLDLSEGKVMKLR